MYTWTTYHTPHTIKPLHFIVAKHDGRKRRVVRLSLSEADRKDTDSQSFTLPYEKEVD